MKIAIRNGFSSPVRWFGLCLWAAALLLPLSKASAAEVWLDYRETSNSVVSWSMESSRELKPFSKEPDTGTRRVARVTLNFGGSGSQKLGCLWDYRQAKLYIDLNGNGDLTDDPEGVYTSARSSSYAYATQTFTNVHLRFKTPAGSIPLCLDLNLYNGEGVPVYIGASCRSFWEGKITFRERDWQIGRVEGNPAGRGVQSKGYLLLRPWEERGTPFVVQAGLLDGFDFPDTLFFEGKAYELGCDWMPQEGQPKYKLTLREVDVPMGELKLTGKSVHRLLLTQSGTSSRGRLAAVFDRPAGVLNLPAGDYGDAQVHLKAGNTTVYRESYPGGNARLAVLPAGAGIEPPVLAAGGPLTNTVAASRRGRELSLSYRLTGADGATYYLASQNRADPPRFSISRAGKVIHSGRFEFG